MVQEKEGVAMDRAVKAEEERVAAARVAAEMEMAEAS